MDAAAQAAKGGSIMTEQYKLKPCPFCGSTDIFAKEECSPGMVRCRGCGVKFVCYGTEERFVKVEGDMYRLIPARNGFEIAVEKWNTRVNSDDLSPVKKGE